MKKVLLLVIAALMVPSIALAAKSVPSGKGGKGAPQVTYVLKGSLSAYAPYDSGTSTNGSITILVKKSNHHGRALKGLSLTFPVGVNTQVKLKVGLTTITDNDRGVVKVRAARKIAPADLAATLQLSIAAKIRDKGAPKH